MKDKAVEESTEIITEVKVVAEVEIGTSIEKSNFLETLVVIETTGGQANRRLRSGSGQVQIETG